MFKVVKNKYYATPKKFTLGKCSTSFDKIKSKKECKESLKKTRKKLSDLQEKLYADDKFSVLLVFQAMDAAGKDSTIASVLKGVNPAGCQVYSFKKPSSEELDHDFLWRTAKSLPERGRIGVFNRSYYEEVLVIKVHPEYIAGQNLPYADKYADNPDNFWQSRYESIASHEKHLSANGTVILKFFLNVSREEQHRRFLSRIETPEKNWKFSDSDLAESKYWDEYQKAYEQLIKSTSAEHAPWFVIPADDKPNMQAQVSKIICEQIENLHLTYPSLSKKEQAVLSKYKSELIIK